MVLLLDDRYDNCICYFALQQDNLRYIGHDINVTGVWENNITGQGITVSVIDDGKYHKVCYNFTV